MVDLMSLDPSKTTASSFQLIVWGGPFLDVDQGSAPREELVQADVRFGAKRDMYRVQAMSGVGPISDIVRAAPHDHKARDFIRSHDALGGLGITR